MTAGRLAVFARQADGRLGRAWQAAPNGEWLPWEELGIVVEGAPAAAQNADGRLELFAAGADGQLGHMWQERGVGGWWSGWVQFGPPIRSDPVVVRNSQGRLELFARGPDRRLGHMWQQPPELGGWSGWEALGPIIAGQPAVSQNPDGHLELFAVGPEGRLGHSWQRPRELGGWSEWKDLGSALAGDPTVVALPDGRLELFAVGPEGRLGHMWHLEPNGASGWSPWTKLGPARSRDPAIVQNTDGRLELFSVGPEGRLGHMWHLRRNSAGGWSPWHDLGNVLTSDPAVVRNADGRLEVFAVGPGGRLGHIWQREPGGTSGWSGWEDLGPEIAPDTVTVCHCNNRGLVDRHLLRQVQQRASSSSAVLVPSVLTADVCVIGAGPAGVTVADGLVRAGASVILVESDGWEDDPAAEVGCCAPLREIDLESRAWVAHSGWPLSPAELAPYQTQAAATLGVEAFRAPQSDGALVWLSKHRPPEPQVFGVMFLNLLASPRFHAELGTTAVALQATGEQIGLVRCGRLAGGELRVAADTIVLAAGGIENARLLLRNQHELPSPNAITGAYLMEHPRILAGTVRLPDEEPLRSHLDRTPLELLALTAECQREQRLLNASIELRRTDEGTASADGVRCELYVCAEQAPNPESRVILGHALDSFGFRQPVLQWQLLEQDWDSAARTAALIASELERQYGARAVVTISPSAPWSGAPIIPSSWDHLGTTRMADDPASGVVDRNSLVYGTSNLYVAGSSVFPTGSCAEATFTIVALAHRLVDHLSARP